MHDTAANLKKSMTPAERVLALPELLTLILSFVPPPVMLPRALRVD